MTRTTKINRDEFQKIAEGIRILNAGIEHLATTYNELGFSAFESKPMSDIIDSLNTITNHWAQNTEPPYEKVRVAFQLGTPKVLEVEETA